MPVPPLHYILSDDDIQEWLKYSKKLLSTVSETVGFIPFNPSASTKQKVVRFFFMDARSAAYDICVLAESLLTNDRHHFSRTIEASRRVLMESTIDYFYISQSDDSVAEQRRDFLSFVNTVDKEDHKKKEKAFRKKYKGTERGDYWSGKSRKEKIEQGMHKYPPIGKNTPFANVVNSIFDYLNEQVHGNTEVPTLI